jgi:hypothetical protein
MNHYRHGSVRDGSTPGKRIHKLGHFMDETTMYPPVFFYPFQSQSNKLAEWQPFCDTYLILT